MYNSKIINQRIASILKTKPFNQKQLLEGCGLNVNLLNKMTDNRGIGCFALAKIADSLEISTDYLLGRTDKPTNTYSISNTHTTINGTQANVINNRDESDAFLEEFMQIFSKLSFENKVKVMKYVNDIKKAPSDDGE